MTQFTGTNFNDIITPTQVSAGVVVSGTPSIPSDAADTINAGGGNDLVDGGGGADQVQLGSGDDIYSWNIGGSNDVVAGQDGIDTFIAKGSSDAETLVLYGNGTQLQLASSADDFPVSMSGIERVTLNTYAGVDSVAITNIAGTGLTQVTVNLAASSGTADGFADNVYVYGQVGAETVTLTQDAQGILVSGLGAPVRVSGADAALDMLTVSTGAGNDTIDAHTISAPAMRLTLDGAEGDDILIGSGGADRLIGGDGNDVVTGGKGADLALLGEGNDRYTWGVGDGNDILNGEDGVDVLNAQASTSADVVNLWTDEFGNWLTRGTESVNFIGMETVHLNALAGTDEIIVGDLSSSAINQLNIDLAGVTGGISGDGYQDKVSLLGSVGADVIRMTNTADGVALTGLRADVNISHIDLTLDQLSLSGSDGDDIIDAAVAGMALRLNGGAGADVLMAGAGSDVVTGGTGNDSVALGAGNDRFVWKMGDGSDLVEGQDGTDVVEVNGPVTNEVVSISANGTRVNLGTDGDFANLDLNGIERIEYNAGAGEDVLFVGEMTGTALTQVVVNLGNAAGVADGQSDRIVVSGRATADSITLTQDSQGLLLRGLAATTRVMRGDATLDNLVVSSGAGNDVIDAQSIASPTVSLTLDGGMGDDRLTGSGGNDLLLGGEGNDRLIWSLGRGYDSMEGGDGNDTAEANGTAAADHLYVNPMANGRVIVYGQASSLGSVHMGTVENLLVKGGAGNDIIEATDGAGALTRLTLDGGDGNDTLIGANGAETFVGGLGMDTIIGGAGNDTALMGDGDDLYVWNYYDGNDVIEGQLGTDTLQFNSTWENEFASISANGTRVALVRDVSNVRLDLAGVDRIEYNSGDGADRLTVGDLSGTAVKLVQLDLGTVGGAGDNKGDYVYVNGRAVADTITVTQDALGTLVQGLSAQTRILHGEKGDSIFLYGNAGNDSIDARGMTASGQILVLNGGTGDDRLLGGGGNDYLFGGDGNDRLQWTLGSGRDVAIGDNGTDTVEVFGTSGNDRIFGYNNSVQIVFSSDDLSLGNVSATSVERAIVYGGDGDDYLYSSTSGFGVTDLTLDGGTGNDTIHGGYGNDRLIGGTGNDTISGGQGSDIIQMGLGDDIYAWEANEGNDIVDGQEGFDTARYAGATGNEVVSITASGSHLIVTRDVQNLRTDLNGVERIEYRANTGSDSIFVYDTSGTNLSQVLVDLRGTGGVGDGLADSVSVIGRAVADTLTITQDAQGFVVNGLAATTQVIGLDTGLDVLSVSGAFGDDIIDSRAVLTGSTILGLDGGDGNDTLLGGNAQEILMGGAGNDLLSGGGGYNFMTGGTGDDTFVARGGVIEDFHAGVSTEDRVDMRGIAGATSFAWIMGHVTQSGLDSILDLGNGEQLTLKNVSTASLHASDFIV